MKANKGFTNTAKSGSKAVSAHLRQAAAKAKLNARSPKGKARRTRRGKKS
jgi:hypothetical protein